jgi:hypothetical protein
MTLEGPKMGSEVGMSIELKMWLGIHTKYSRIHLGFDSRKLDSAQQSVIAWNLGIQTCLLTCLLTHAGFAGLQCWCFVQSQHPQLRAKHLRSDSINARLQVHDVYHVAEVGVCQEEHAYVALTMSC